MKSGAADEDGEEDGVKVIDGDVFLRSVAFQDLMFLRSVAFLGPD